MDLAYAALMDMCTEGTFLYTPAQPKSLHPGSCGFFDRGGRWRPITDLTASEHLTANGYSQPETPLAMEDPTTSKWKKMVVERNEEGSFGVKAEVSGLAAQAPVDLGANAAVGSTAKAGVGLVVSPNVVYEKVDSKTWQTIMKWVQTNVKSLTAQHKDQIARFGVWVITGTWVTEKCEIAMWNKTGKKISVGAEVGATNIGKLGVNTSRDISVGADEHKVYDEPGGHVVSFDGFFFRPSRNIFSKRLVKRLPKDGYLRTQPESITIDADGNVIQEPKAEPVVELEEEWEEESDGEQDVQLDIVMVGFQKNGQKVG